MAVFDAILSGPPKARYLEEWGEEFTDELFESRQRYFHRMQLTPFAPVLFGTYTSYFRGLEDGEVPQISDDSYLLIGDVRGGRVVSQSPQSPEDLAGLTDLELLDYINQWDEAHRYVLEDDGTDGFIEVNIEALAEAFKTVFHESILLDTDRFRFWVAHREDIERTIFVRAMIEGMEQYVKQARWDSLAESLAVCEWVLSHPDQDPGADFRAGDQSRDTPNWHSSRRAVGDLVGACLEEKSSVPAQFQGQLASLLAMLCTQSDWRLDSNEAVLPRTAMSHLPRPSTTLGAGR